MKKTAAIVWVITMLIFIVATAPTQAIAENEYVSGVYSYTINTDGSATITGYNAVNSTVIIPDVLSNRAVTGIADGAFLQSNKIKTIVLPVSVQTLGQWAFSSCTSIEAIDVSPDNPSFSSIDGVLFRKEDRTLLVYPSGKTETEYTVPYGIAAIGNSAFFNCTALRSVLFPDTLQSIGDWAFSNCDSIASISLPGSLQTIGDGAFSNCSGLISIAVSPYDAVFLTVDNVLFNAVTKTLIAYPAGNMETSYTVPGGIQSIAAGAFANCYTLTSISLPDSLISIGDSAFENCTRLSTISQIGVFPSDNGSAQSGYSMLTDNILPDQLLTIGSNAFYHCSMLTTLGLPESLQFIGDQAFDDCDNLSLIVPRNSYAYTYAVDADIAFQYSDALDWLNP